MEDEALYAVPEPVEVVAGGGRAGRSDLASAMVGSRSTHGCREEEVWWWRSGRSCRGVLHVSKLDRGSSVTIGQTTSGRAVG